MSSSGATENIQKAVQSHNFAEKSVCFIGNLSKEAILKASLNMYGCCAYGVTLKQSGRGLIDLITEEKLDKESILRILIQEAKDAVIEQKSRAVALALFGYEKHYDVIKDIVSVDILRPSSALPSLFNTQERSIGLIGTSFDLNRGFWDKFSREHDIRIVLPEESEIAEFDVALRNCIQLKGRSVSDLEQLCSKQVKNMLGRPNPPDQVLLCNLESHQALKRIRCEHHGTKIHNISNVLWRLVMNFSPS